MAIAELFAQELKVINIGLTVFYETLEASGVQACLVSQAGHEHSNKAANSEKNGEGAHV